MKKILLVSVFLFSLMLIAAPIGFAGNPPPPGTDQKFVGPAVVGTITITPGGIFDGISAIFSGHCRGIQFTLGPRDFGGSFDAVTPELLEGETLGYVGEGEGDIIPLDCAPSKGGFATEVRIFNVTHFSKIGNVITAHVVAMSLVPK
jgi:hypothetical protein